METGGAAGLGVLLDSAFVDSDGWAVDSPFGVDTCEIVLSLPGFLCLYF